MRLIYFSNSELFSKKANSIQVMKMCEAFSKDFEEVVLYAYSEKNTIENVYEFYDVKDNFKIKTYPFKKNRINRIINSIFALIPFLFVNRKKTIIYAREIFSVFFCSILNIKYVYEIHNLPSPNVIYFLKRVINASSNLFLVTISDRLKLKLVELYRPKNKIYSLHDGATLKPLNFKNPPKFYNQSTLNIAYVGHLYKGRGIELIIELALRLPQFNFQLIGGEDEDIKRLRRISPKNIYFHGYVPPKQTDKFRFFSDILLMPYMDGLGNKGSLSDTSSWMSPMKLFEYMSSRKPILSTDLPVLREVLNESNAILIPYEPTEWEKAIMKIYNDREFGYSLAEKAYQDLKTKYTWSKRSETIRNLINNSL